MPTLDWIGKKAVINHHNQAPFHLLKEVPEFSVGEPGSGNLIVEGDNLLALKALLPYYAGRVNCIYIDPPYNTGNEGWIYNDNVNSPEIREWLGKTVGGQATDLSRHDKWLCMMYPRLSLLKEFLNETGSIWVSMDDSEISLLRLLMDEIFGKDRFIACIVWQKRYSRENREAIGDVHEFILVYAKNPESFKRARNLVPPDEVQSRVYKNSNNDPKGRWRGIPMTAQGYRPNQMYEIVTPAGVVHKPPEGRCWSMIESEFKKLIEEGRIYFGKNQRSQPSVIRYLSEVEGFVPWTWWPHDEVGHTDEAKKEIRAIFGTQTAFETPKPVRLIQRIVQIATKPGDLILDSFAGSGTTGHAVMQLNKQENSNRRFILVEMDPDICRKVTSERLRKVCSGYEKSDGAKVEKLGGGFRFCKLGAACFDEHGRVNPEVKFSDLARHVFFTETGEPIPKQVRANNPLIGIYKETAIYLLYNGILKDKRIDGGNVLTQAVLDELPKHDGPKIIYGEACRFGPTRLKRENIIFKQIPYQIKIH
jgi:DNA modification methylase